MGCSDGLNVEDKMKIIRMSKGLTQKGFAKILGCNPVAISRIESKKEENKNHKYKKDQVKIILKELGLEGAPIFEGEDVVYKNRLYTWLDAMINERNEEAEQFQKDLSVIMYLPFEPELMLMYEIFDIKLIMLSNAALAEEMLKLLEKQKRLDDASNENLYHFNFTAGVISFYKKKFKEALRYYLKAEGLEVDDLNKSKGLNLNISYCYSELGMHVYAIASLERMHFLFDGEVVNLQWLKFLNALAVCHMSIGDTGKAKQLLDKAFIDAKSISNERYINIILHNLGCVSIKTKEYDKALEYFEDAFNFFKEGDDYYLENLYYKARCLVALKSSQAKEVISCAKSALKDNEEYKLLFESLEHLLTLKDEQSRQFIQRETIPHLRDSFKYFKALDYCDTLKASFGKRESGAKIFKVDSIALEISRKMMKGIDV